MQKTIKSDLTLNMDEKVYLAVSKNTAGKIAFVYTLACLQFAGKPNTYDMTATRESHAFSDKNAAEIFYESVKRIVGFNAADKNRKMLFSFNENLIKGFNENVR